MNPIEILSEKKLSRNILFISFVFVLLVLFFVNVISPPTNFSADTTIIIEDGESIKKIAKQLKEQNIIKSGSLFSILIQISKNPIVASGEYIFDEPENIFSVVNRMKKSQFNMPTETVTITEGMTVREIAKKLSEKFDRIDEKEFIDKAIGYEGKLFPDTYKFNLNANADVVIATLQKNFDKKIDSIKEQISQSKYSLEEIIKMASIVEKEATLDSRQEVSNILWKRYEMNMALQVDAAFVYSIGKSTADLTTDDLKNDRPYNTYTRTGLPPTPIGNPGLEAILAAANPQKTENLYFLTGRDGKMYYAKSFEGHKRNRALYLD